MKNSCFKITLVLLSSGLVVYTVTELDGLAPKVSFKDLLFVPFKFQLILCAFHIISMDSLSIGERPGRWL